MPLIERLRRPGLRRRLTLVLVVGAIALTTALVGGFNIVLRSGLRHDVDSALRARASSALASLAVANGRVRVREAPGDEAIDRQVWVFEGNRLIEAPRDGGTADAAVRAAARQPRRFRDIPSFDLRVFAQRVRTRGATATVVAGVSLAPYEHTATRALVASVVLGLVVLVAILAAVRWTIAASLKPVDRMTAEAAAWSVHDLDHRLAGAGPRDELSRLAATFNDLLSRLTASLRHEQRFSAEVSHELRTPLAQVVAESELALRRDRAPDEYRTALAAVLREARQMERVIDTLVAVARSEANPRSGTSDATAVAESVTESLSGRVPNGVELEVRPDPSSPALGVDGDLAERVLAPIVENALRYARSHAVIAVGAHDGVVDFVVTDDGPGVPADLRESVFTPGFRGAPASGQAAAAEGAGLGLALARRLAVAAGGTVRCEPAGDAGSVFLVTLPAA